MFNILFKAASQTLLCFGENKLGGKLDFICTLRTWDQKLNPHFHLHSLPAGFVRIRHYGFLANRNRSQNLKATRKLMGLPDPAQKPSACVEDRIKIFYNIFM